MKSIVIFASGSGTNAEKIISYFQDGSEVNIAALFTDKPACGAVDIASDHNIIIFSFNLKELYDGTVLKKLKEINPDLIVLAGFLKLLSGDIIHAFRGKIINIHPALLPKYGGKGFYGKFVHEAVLAAKDPVSGITIHMVDDEYDKGEIIFQKECLILENDTPASLAERVRNLEHEHYAQIIEHILKTGGDKWN